MSYELLEIQPSLLKFTFELRKQSSCLIQLTNRSEDFVGFKVTTTSPNKYAVRPNLGVIKAKGAADLTVIMQAQGVAPPDLLCKDKFRIQTTIVPFGLETEHITSEMFVKNRSKQIEEKKLKVMLITPTNCNAKSPVSLPSNGVLKTDLLSNAFPQSPTSSTGRNSTINTEVHI